MIWGVVHQQLDDVIAHRREVHVFVVAPVGGPNLQEHETRTETHMRGWCEGFGPVRIGSQPRPVHSHATAVQSQDHGARATYAQHWGFAVDGIFDHNHDLHATLTAQAIQLVIGYGERVEEFRLLSPGGGRAHKGQKTKNPQTVVSRGGHIVITSGACTPATRISTDRQTHKHTHDTHTHDTHTHDTLCM